MNYWMEEFIRGNEREMIQEIKNSTMTAESLINNGYQKFGNWFIKESISINLFTKEIKSNCKVKFSHIFNNSMTLEKCNEIENMLSSLLID